MNRKKTWLARRSCGSHGLPLPPLIATCPRHSSLYTPPPSALLKSWGSALGTSGCVAMAQAALKNAWQREFRWGHGRKARGCCPHYSTLATALLEELGERCHYRDMDYWNTPDFTRHRGWGGGFLLFFLNWSACKILLYPLSKLKKAESLSNGTLQLNSGGGFPLRRTGVIRSIIIRLRWH